MLATLGWQPEHPWEQTFNKPEQNGSSGSHFVLMSERLVLRGEW